MGNGMSETVQPSPILELGQQQLLAGYLPGLKQPVLIVGTRFLTQRIHRERLAAFDQTMLAALGTPEDLKLAPDLARHPVLGRVVRATLGVLALAGMPLLDMASMRQRPGKNGPVLELLLPALHEAQDAMRLALKTVVGILNQPASANDGNAGKESLLAAIRNISPIAPSGMNTLRFLQAANAANIPWRRIVKNVYQFGWGAQARWLDSSFTDQTPNLASMLARDKQAAAKLLRDAGIPVPAHGQVRNEAMALRAAEQLGYPVVVKAANLDGGQGVYAGLKTPEAVRKAYAEVIKLTQSVLVEKHFEGNDYRIQVLHGEVYWAVHRRPAGVFGDGVQTIDALIRQANADPMRGEPGTKALLKRITIDEEARDWLMDQGCALDTVPQAGRFIRLRGAANIASGGTIEPVLEQAHPDNLALAIRATRAMRLDVAGVDLLIPDIRQSWLQSGAVICEINAQPQLSPQLPAYVLKKLVAGEGRIPVAIVIGDPRQTPWLAHLQSRLEQQQRVLGLALPQGVWVGTSQVTQGYGSALEQGVALLSDPGVETVLLAVQHFQAVQSGLPIDAMDALVLAGPVLDSRQQPDWPYTLQLARTLAGLAHQVFVDADCTQWLEALPQLDIKSVQHRSGAALADSLALLMEGANR